MLALKNFFSGTSLLTDPGPSGAMITLDITIGTVTDVNKTLFFFTHSIDQDVDFTRTQCISVRLLNASTLRVQWWDTFGQVVVHSICWWVLEFTEGVSVQHYYSATQPASPISINTVDTTKSFIIPSWAVHTTEGSNSYVNAGANVSFASGSSVTLTNGDSLLDHFAMQVVQWDGAKAQHSITNIEVTSPVDTVITTVASNRAVLFSTNNWTAIGDVTGVNQYARCYLNDENTIRISVLATGFPQNLAASVVEIPHFSVQRGATTLFSASSATAAISSVDTTKSIPWVSMPNRPFAQRNEGSVPEIYGGAHATLLTFNSATEINIARGRPWSNIAADWQVMEFQPPPPRKSAVAFLDPATF